jgi:hypothetical protein
MTTSFMLTTIEEQRNYIFWQSVPRGYNLKDLLDRSSLHFTSVQDVKSHLLEWIRMIQSKAINLWRVAIVHE